MKRKPPAVKTAAAPPMWRQHFILTAMFAVFAVLAWRVVHLHTVESERLHAQGDARYLREVAIAAQRGRILDRFGRALAVSTPVESLWASPTEFCKQPQAWTPMIDALALSDAQLRANCEKHQRADFMYLKRLLPPAQAQRMMQLTIPGVHVRREYKRYYPGGPAGAHLIGFTNIDDIGQEGLERAHQTRLGGAPGKLRALKDRLGNYVEHVESLRAVQHGEDLVISIDQRIQSLAGDYLETAVQKNRARGGSLVVVRVPSGEILAMVNSPQFNPNDRATIRPGAFRNRSVTDVFEPGSTIKPFTIAAALERGQWDAASIVDTSPGHHQIGGHKVHDARDYGKLSLFDVVVHSSNVGAAKVALDLPGNALFDSFSALGFGRRAAQLPGEANGVLLARRRPIERATFSYGYGLSVTALQLARAYTALATDGVVLDVTLMRKDDDYHAPGVRAFSAQTAHTVRQMLEAATGENGTAPKARIARYRIGGKTGTVHKLINGQYDERYVSLFAGIAPLEAPAFVVVVMVDDPRGRFYYGGDVAAPVFAELTADLMRLYNIAPTAARATAARARQLSPDS